ncbi:MAG: hypothetical protein H6721_08620 [Sandaracinus sp.]|nr:hypothetical protein [Sandaracinus sp.]
MPSRGRGLRAANLILVLDGLSDPGNVGAVARTANAWGARGLIAVDGLARLRPPKAYARVDGRDLSHAVCRASRVEVARRLRGDLCSRSPRRLRGCCHGRAFPTKRGTPRISWSCSATSVAACIRSCCGSRRGRRRFRCSASSTRSTSPTRRPVVLWERARRRGAS